MNITRIARLVRPVFVGVMAIAALTQAVPSAAQQRSKSNFDHLRTRFPLTGAHAVTPCETCHIGGQMAGTPTQCDYCHRAGSRIAVTVKPVRHVQTAEPCDVCHRSSATWTGARFSHVAVTPGTCFSCHNGSTASGKPGGHLMTTASCDSCHRTSAWLPAGFNHASVAPGSCATCHTPGGSGLAKPANHIPYESQLLAGSSLGCDACHSSTTSFTVERMNHNNSQGNGAGFCRGCHLSGTNFLGRMQKKSLTHQKSTGVTDCSQSGCHRPLGTQGSTYRSW